MPIVPSNGSGGRPRTGVPLPTTDEVVQPADYPDDATPEEKHHWTGVRVNARMREFAERYGIENLNLLDRSFEEQVAYDVSRQLARAIYEEETGRSKPAAEWPRTVSLAEFLDEPDDEVAYRVDRLWPTNGRVVLAAQKKAGKTTLVGNVVHSLADGEPFLGKYDTQPAERTILMDNEMSEGQLRRWLRDHAIENTTGVDVISLRGRLSAFNILDPHVRSQWAAHLGAADVLIFDCLRPALDALGLNEHTDAGRFLEALDELVAEAGIRELMVVHHMGHSNERSRGDSRIGDWPDANWKLVPTVLDDGTPDEHGPRYFSAMGRDVAEPEAQLGYSEFDRSLHIAGGNRREQAVSGAEQAILAFVEGAAEPPSGNELLAGLEGDHPKVKVRAARKRLVSAGRLIEEARTKKGGGMQYRLPTDEEAVL